MKATAVARANIALAKYWGKSDDALNLPAVPSVSLTLDPLVTETTVELDEGLDDDVFELDGQPAKDGETKRVRALLDEVRALAGVTTRARVTSRNRFPTAAGLASSASGFAALAGAASAAVGLDDSAAVLSARARRASASAARSIFGGVVELPAGVPGDDALAARPIAAADHWDLRVVVAITASGRKSIGSRDAMGESRRSSPYYGAWVEHAATSTRAICDALLARDFAALAPLVEQSFLAMHAVGMAGIPSVLYWQPGSVAAIRTIQGLRADGLDVCATMDAGPHVKAVCTAAAAPSVREALAATDGVLDTLEARIGPGLEVTPRMTRVVVSAPGKLMISGEYVVLDGAEALVAAVDRRLVVIGSAAAPDRSGAPSGGSPDGGSLPPEALLARQYAEAALGETPMDLTLDASALRSGAHKLGLGSSSAASAAAAGAVLAWRGEDPAAHRRQILGWALAGHRAIAPEGSGADVAAATLGGIVRFTRSRAEAAESLDWPYGLWVEVVWTGKPARTNVLVAKVKSLAVSDPAAYRARMSALRDASDAFLAAFVDGDAARACLAADAHGVAMGALGDAADAPIVTEELHAVAELARTCGGGAKPSGAGGGDVALAFFRRAEDAARFRAGCAAADLTLLSLTLGAEGVLATER